MRWRELAALFLKLGSIGFGGPAAHIAMMEDEVVRRRQWTTHEHFLDMLGVTKLIPGPNSTEMAIHIGLVRAGWRGMIIAGVCFIAPAILVTLIFAHLYVIYGALPQIAPVVAGVRPAIIAVILGAVFRLGKPLVNKNKTAGVIGITVAAMALANANEMVLLFAGGMAGVLWKNRERLGRFAPFFLASAFTFPVAIRPVGTLLPTDGVTATTLGLFFLKIGSILYGSGYVLVAFLQEGLVGTHHWLTHAQLIDAIAAGQFTPGPVLSTAAFIGYVLLGLPGAAAATIGIFLPSFIYVPLVSPLIPRIRRMPSVGLFLDGVNASALGLMLAVCITLGANTLMNPVTWFVFLGTGISMLVWNLHPAWLVLGSALVSWLSEIVHFS